WSITSFSPVCAWWGGAGACGGYVWGPWDLDHDGDWWQDGGWYGSLAPFPGSAPYDNYDPLWLLNFGGYGAAYWPTGGDHDPDPTFRPKLTAAQHDLDAAKLKAQKQYAQDIGKAEIQRATDLGNAN